MQTRMPGTCIPSKRGWFTLRECLLGKEDLHSVSNVARYAGVTPMRKKHVIINKMYVGNVVGANICTESAATYDQ